MDHVHAGPRFRFAAILLVLAVAIPIAGPGASADRATPARSVLPLPGQTPSHHPRPRFDAHRVVVRFRAGASAVARERALSSRGLRAVARVRRLPWSVLDTGGRRARAVVRSLRRDRAVADAELDYVRQADKVPNDEFYASDQQKYMSNARFEQAWNTTTGSTSWSVAVVDTGVDLTHPDLNAHIKAGYDFVNDDDRADDDNGHGTFVAGVAAAVTNNSQGVAGGAWNAGIMPVKVLDSNGSGMDDVISDGITWAADNGADVINLSFGGYGESAMLQSAVEYAIAHDVVVVVAAGNDGTSLPSFPAAYDGVIAVSATDRSGTFAYFSNHGWWVDLSAPGMSITSTYPESLTPPGFLPYAIGDGTSFAAPLVAGAAVLTRVHNQAWTQSQVVDQLEKTAQDRGPAGEDPFYGRGWLDAYAAVGGSKQSASPPASGDGFEPNDTLGRAKSVSGSASTSISPEGDQDWFKTNVSATGSVTFTVTPPAPDPTGSRTREMDPTLEVYGPDKTFLGSMDQTFLGEPETLRVPVTTTGNYYLRVQNYLGSRSSANYTVSVSTSTSAPPPLSRVFDVLSTATSQSPVSVGLGDVTGDGRPDVVASTVVPSAPAGSDANLFVYPQGPDGALGDGVPYASDGSATDQLGLAVGDLDGDSKSDVAVATSAGIDVYSQQGDGTLGKALFLLGGTSPRQVEMADLTGDGKTDMVVQSSRGIYLELNTGGGFSEFTIFEGPTPGIEIEVADVTEDGEPDVVSMGSSSVTVWIQAGGGTFSSQVYPLAATLRGIAVGDFDHDGRMDVAASQDTLSTDNVEVLLQDPVSHQLEAPVAYKTAAGPGPMEAPDVDGDGTDDVVVLHGGQDQVGVYLQNSSHKLATESTYLAAIAQSFPQPKTPGIGDVDGDGLADVEFADARFGVGAEYGLTTLRQVPLHTPAWIKTTKPNDFATGVARNTSPYVTFGRSIDPASITPSTAWIKNGNSWAIADATLSFGAGAGKLTFQRSGNFSKTVPYVVFLDGLMDVDGNPMPPYAFRFTTGSS
jgi:serine protease